MEIFLFQMDDMETIGKKTIGSDPSIQEMLDEFRTDFDNIRVKTLQAGKYK